MEKKKKSDKLHLGPYNFKEVEGPMLEFWKKNEIYSKAKEKARKRAEKSKKKQFYFLDGPPYTSGKVHIGTAWNKVLKDCILRYKRMSGVDVWDRAGYDMHGLPTEHATEKKLGLKNKDDILRIGVAKFVEECRKLSIENMKLMNEDFIKLGVWMDFENAYQSIKNEFIEGEWWLIKKAHENKRLYEGLRTMHWCAHCATALAKHELEYEEIRENSIFLKFKVVGSENEYLIVWTTTPWTLAFNLAVMVNPELEYVRCEVADPNCESENRKSKEANQHSREIWILSKALAGPVVQAVADKKMRIIEEFKGEEIKGLKYEHPWVNEIPALKELKEKNDKVHTVVMSKEYVDVSAGSGLVHCAPGCGPEDYEVGHREGLPPFNTIDEQGRFPKEMGIFSGLVAKKDDDKFIEALKDKGSLIAVTPVEHDYAHCWRCHYPVVFRTTKQWFFKIEDLKENMRELNKSIYWVPDWAGNRQFDAWLDNLRDNSITKQRFWGTPLPIWRCEKCGNYDVIGSIKELKEKAKKLPKDLHKPWIDEIKYKCSCGGIKKKIPDVIDVWVDAGCTSWICIGYPQKKELFDKMYPPDFILEGKDQIRGWFNLLFVASMVSMQRPSYKAVYMHGWVNDAQGRKMSKSLGNYIIPQEVVDKYGADAFRYYSIGGTNPGLDLNYNFDDVKIKFKNLSVLWNLHNLLLDLHYQGIKTPATAKGIELSVEERYMLSKLHSTIKKATEKFELYYINEIPAIVEELFLDLSRTYIQLVREKLSGTDEEKKTAMYIIYNVLLETLKLFAPVAPFITEKIYQNLRKAFDLKEKSIHLYDWPSYDKKMIDEGLEKDFAILNNILQSIFAAREKSQLGLRWPLKKIYIITKNEDIIKAVKNLEETLKRQANVKEIEIRDLMPYIKRRIKADYATIGPEFGQNSAKVIAQFSIMPAEAIFRRIEENGFYDLNIDGEIFRLKREHLIVEEDMPKNIIKAESKGCDIYLDIERTRELDAEGFAREIIRRTQQLRKEAGLKKPDRISMYIRSDSDMINMIRKWQDNIKEKVGADDLKLMAEDRLKEYKYNKEEKIKGKTIKIGFDIL